MSMLTALKTKLYPAKERGHVRLGWLESYHTFSFSNFYDPQRMGFSQLRVINHDYIAPQGGFPNHPHQDMEILTYVLKGALEHRDSLGNGAIIQAGDVQIMSAGTGIIHSEFNPSSTEPVELLQIWIHPDQQGLSPRYAQESLDPTAKLNQFHLIAAPPSQGGTVIIYQDARISAANLQAGHPLTQDLAPGRLGWLEVAQGEVLVNDHPLQEGDGLAVTGPGTLTMLTMTEAELLWFDLPPA
ncbi:pirin family protein [Thermosynechococcaceae cyanobacterium BACA0444]|uniref:Pirin family protein n=1 Tax=Pseudocalidococcus azoricus BACA0444 TaxID=2918990 RepID=A0AAE4JYG4_9CYAN|nr:pirin family protein [Pseudocalidococcus azoricus]MDS3859677.1 pirin family protein [Pseudocalidococcus azoricus BACA0444]